MKGFKKRFIAGCCAMLMCVSLAGCSDPGSSEEGTATKGDSENIVMGFSQIGAESGWRTANTDDIKRAATDAGIDLQFSDAQQKQENQIKAIRSFIANQVDIIVLTPIVETGWDTVLKEAKDAEIPVLIVDRDIKCDDSLYVAKIGTDQTEEGRKAFKWLDSYSYLTEKKVEPKNGKTYGVAILFGYPIVMNPLLLIGVIFVPILNGIITYLLMSMGLVGSICVNIPWTLPGPIGAFIATMDWKAAILWFALFVMDIFLFMPFIKLYDRQMLREECGNDEKA